MLSSLRMAADVFGVMLTPGQSDAGRLYTALGSVNNLAKETLFLNLGYWEKATEYDAACRALAHHLGEAADLGPDDELLDVGYGFGDQDLYWMEQFQPRRIIGLNVTALQVEKARQRVNEAGFSDRIDLRLGSATDMRVADCRVDKVLGLETAFHYVTRERFFREAFRVLRPGGRLVLADIIPRTPVPRSWREKTGQRLACAFWQIPLENMVTADEYCRQLTAAGFQKTKLRSIADRVYQPFVRYARRCLREPEIANRMNPFVRWMWRASVWDEKAWNLLDYVIVTAEKPHD